MSDPLARRALVTGGSGFIGTHLVQRLAEDGYTVTNVDTARPTMESHLPSWKRVDILDREALEQAFAAAQPDIVFHLAAVTALDEDPSPHFYAPNVQGVQNVVEAVQRTADIQRVIFVSSRLVNSIDHVPDDDMDMRPSTRYGESKMLGERIVRSSSHLLPDWVIVRPTGIWGPGFGVPYRDFFMHIWRGRYVHLRGRDTRKSFGYVGNTVHQLLALAEAPRDAVAGRTFVLADPPLSVHDWAERIQREFGARRIPKVPYAVLQLAAKLGDAAQRVGWSPPLTSFRLRNMTTNMVFDTGELSDLVGPLPYTVDEGIAHTVAWLRFSERHTGEHRTHEEP